MSVLSKFLLILTLVMGFSVAVKADPIRIFSGNVTNSGINVQGQNSTQISLTPDPCCIITATNPRFTFAPGSKATPMIDAFGNYNGLTTFTFRGSTQIIGVSYPQTLIPPASSSFMAFTIAQPLSMPPSPALNQGTAPFTVDVPFTMQGYLAGFYYPNGQQNPPSALSGTSIYGSGTARFSFSYDPVQSGWNITRYEYTFGTPEPTPEPATIFLLGTGLAGIVGYARRKRNSKQTA